MVRPARPKFVLFGSSLVQFSFSHGGWGALLANIYSRKADICLRGYAGWNSRQALQVLEEVFPKNEAVQPSLVIVYFGGNDSIHAHPSGLGSHVPLQEYMENMRKIATHLKSLSKNTHVIFLSTPPISEEQLKYFHEISERFVGLGRTNELGRMYASACVELCKELDDLKVIDLWTVLQQREDWSTVCFIDGIHLSAEGSKMVVREILKVLKEADWDPSLHWKSVPTEYSEDSPYYITIDGTTTANSSETTVHWEMQWE